MKNLFSLFFLLLILSSCSVLKDGICEKVKFYDSKYKVSLLEKPITRLAIKESGIIEEYRFLFKDSSIVYLSKSDNGSDLLYDFLEVKDFFILQENGYFEKSFEKDNKSYLIVKDKGLIYGFSNLNPEKVNLYKNLFKTTLVKIQ